MVPVWEIILKDFIQNHYVQYKNTVPHENNAE